ncbi:MAG TPA: sortase, partial [Candidatus Dormibacteraeota bacterium]|nr:sortase [Candidatus Dormibacteraeota bacterium]
GNTYLYAHDRPGMFLGLHQARVGDVIIVALTQTQKLYFQVTEIHPNVAWNDFEWLRPSKDSRLTLQTCNYSGDFDPRYIVVTQPIPASQGQALTGGV